MSEQARDFPDFISDTTERWDQIADWWDDAIGDGNRTQDLLVEPTTERLLDLRPAERVLDVACGAGRFARRMADRGARILAVDQSERFLERARRRSKGYDDRIEYRLLNAADEPALASLGEAAFDAVVCTMALMDMASITPLAAAIPRLLRPEGRFVFSVIHPVFNSGDSRPTAERVEAGTDVRTRYAVSVADYLDARELLGIGIAGQPVQQHYFHRPVGQLLNTFLDAGLVLDRLEECAFPPGTPTSSPLGQPLFTGIPWVLVARLRLA